MHKYMTLDNSPIPLASLHINTGSLRFISIILNTFLKILFGLQQPLTPKTWCTVHYHEIKMTRNGMVWISQRAIVTLQYLYSQLHHCFI